MYSVSNALSHIWPSAKGGQVQPPPSSGAPSKKSNTSRCNQGARLAKELKKLESFLPAPEIVGFKKNNVSLNFDIQKLDASNLSSLYDTMASSFWFSRDVQELYSKAKGSFSWVPPSFSGTEESALCKCVKMAQLINTIAPEVMDKNLEKVWIKLENQYEFPHFETAKEMREYLNNNNKVLEVTRLDLSRSDIEIVPPEVLLFPNLSQVILFDTKIAQFPQVLKAHPTLNLEKVYCEDLTFTIGTDLHQEEISPSCGPASAGI